MAGKGSACAWPGSVGAEHGAIKSATRALSEKPRARRNPDRGNQKSVNRGIEKGAENELIYRAHFGFLRAWTLNEYWRGTKYETILGSQCETILGSRFGGMELGFRTMWGARIGPGEAFETYRQACRHAGCHGGEKPHSRRHGPCSFQSSSD